MFNVKLYLYLTDELRMVLIKVPFKDISIFIKLALQVTDKKRAFLVLQYLCNRSQGLGNIEVGKSENREH